VDVSGETETVKWFCQHSVPSFLGWLLSTSKILEASRHTLPSGFAASAGVHLSASEMLTMWAYEAP